MTSLRVAAVQASYVLMDQAAALDRVAALTAEAAAQGAQLVAFPGVFVRGVNVWSLLHGCPNLCARRRPRHLRSWCGGGNQRDWDGWRDGQGAPFGEQDCLVVAGGSGGMVAGPGRQRGMVWVDHGLDAVVTVVDTAFVVEHQRVPRVAMERKAPLTSRRPCASGMHGPLRVSDSRRCTVATSSSSGHR
jgi:hypothetical protein